MNNIEESKNFENKSENQGQNLKLKTTESLKTIELKREKSELLIEENEIFKRGKKNVRAIQE